MQSRSSVHISKNKGCTVYQVEAAVSKNYAQMVLSYLAKTLSQLPNCLSNDIDFGGRIRKRYFLTFTPPSTKTPIFRYGGNDDQRSFLSLASSNHFEDEQISEQDDESEVTSVQLLPADMNDIETDPLLSRNIRNGSNSSDCTADDLSPQMYSPKKYHSINASPNNTTDGIIKLQRQNSKSSVQTRKSINLTRQNSNARQFLNGEYEAQEDFQHEVVTKSSEIKTFVKNVVPLIITFCLCHSYTIVCLITASKTFGLDMLSAVSLGSMTSTVTFSIFEGISTSLDILCPQAYGSGNVKKVGLYTQRSILFSLVCFIPFAILWWNSHIFFRLVLETEELVYLTTTFLRILILAAPAYIIFENVKRFLQCQGIYNAPTLVLGITTPLSIFLIRVLVVKIGYIGIPIVCVLNFWAMCILIILYIMFVDGSACWNGFSMHAFSGWGEIARFGSAGVVCTFLENFSWEILTLFSTYFGTTALAAQSAVSTVACLTFFVPLAVGIASSTRVANFIGTGRIGPAKLCTQIGLIAGLVSGLLNGCILYFGRYMVAHSYSNDQEVIQLIIKTMPYVALIQVFDSMNTVAGSLLRGQGAPYIGGVINFVVYDFFAIPMAALLAYHYHLELAGLWIGIGLGLMVISISETYFVFTVDWEDAIAKCVERNRIKL